MFAVGETRLDATQARAGSGSIGAGRYRIVGPLSKGGMAELSLALQVGVQGFTRVVALKRVLAAHVNNPQFLEMFLDEARLAARLDHPNIVRIYDLGQDGESYFMAMEYLPGEDLRQLHELVAAANGRIAPELAAHLVERAADALHFAHGLTDENGAHLGLVHRDVSPSNILVTYDGLVKVVDFGIAKATTNAFETGAGVMKGKLGYLAPEQFTGAAVDRRCDVYGLGIVLWELLTNTRLFVRDTAAATLAAASAGEVPLIYTFREDVSDELEAIVQKALAHDPADRFQTAGEMAEALEHYLRAEGLPPTTHDVATWVEGLGGTRRAELKKAIARGTNVGQSYLELAKLPWDDATSRPGSSSVSRSRRRPLWQVAVFALAGAALLALAGVIASPEDDAGQAQLATATVVLESEPSGAFVFIGGEPTGQLTPATIGGLNPLKPLVFRLDKPGYAPASDELPLKGAQTVTKHVQLRAVDGLVRFTHVPDGAAVRVADKIVLAGQEVTLPPGKYAAEVLIEGRVVSTRPIAVVPGPQEVPVTP